MIRKLAAIVALAGLATLGIAAPSSAQAQRGVVDCSPSGTSWPAWTNMGNPAYAAGRVCGDPDLAPPSPARAWDKASDGLCASIWFQINAGATVYKITPTEACGINVIKAGSTPSYSVYAVYVAAAPAGTTSWANVPAWVQIFP